MGGGSGDNSMYIDSNTAQKLTSEDIESLKDVSIVQEGEKIINIYNIYIYIIY